MMKLSIITINYNNAEGLRETIQSVAAQTCKDFEYVVVDGGSKDGSAEILESYASTIKNYKWISEQDGGIYNAMNKGIRMASGAYVQFLNSSDCLVDENVVEHMLRALKENDYPSILYGNMLKQMPNGYVLRDRCFAGSKITLRGFYVGTLNHSPAYIKRDLFEKYGYYDETFKIVSDWKWYMKVIIWGEVCPMYVDIDVTLFDMKGISETNKALDKTERRKVLEQMIPETILSDYDKHAFDIEQMTRLKRYKLIYKLVWFTERCLNRVEKVAQKLKKETRFR